MTRLPVYLNTRTLTSHLFFGPYIYLPLLAGCTWLGGILALLGLWVKNGEPQYKSSEATVVFISDVGAHYHALFIGICTTTAGLYILSLFAERWLRHVDRLPTDLRKRETVFDALAIVLGIIGGAALILLSIFDAFDYSTIHWSMTVVFVVAVALSAIFQTGEVWSLHKDHPDRKSLLRNSIIKLLIILVAVACAVAFGVCYGLCDGSATAHNDRSAATCNRITSVSAAMEWAVALVLVFYFFTLAADLWPAGKSSSRYMRRLAKWQEKHGEGDDFTGRRAFGMYPERWEGNGAGPASGNGPSMVQTTAGGGAGWRAREAVMRQEMHNRNEGIRHESDEPRDSMASAGPMLPPPPHFGDGTPRESLSSGRQAPFFGAPVYGGALTQPV